ncbi:uncharacterized protein PGTG_01208 [Puccinia graminis f. sp. tritici CRL 75-36-700-3]|uniref:Uncharacterized protein n=1 Tax=Puccinia graminis f. sp. tritici (strain CRL 75-36-700-3 / race SCCL) TaxID=418459 RepID=E3JV02_PUCGT|nr:uncharacterized protein PGTG_01208 [Puccinia graminis f. sp. tritici CRL 75-36-700-3]EFP75877.1 hypothetical protein PGTG_01208 [Puccinia graminis f. sp. tritici CRL 75-36-700-3]
MYAPPVTPLIVNLYEKYRTSAESSKVHERKNLIAQVLAWWLQRGLLEEQENQPTYHLIGQLPPTRASKSNPYEITRSSGGHPLNGKQAFHYKALQLQLVFEEAATRA